MVSAIIVAAGRGSRMQGALPKQFLSLDGLPILTRTLMVFDRCDLVQEIILVTSPDDFDYCETNIIQDANLNRKITLAAGGKRRQDSVYNGLKRVGSNCQIVAIHDGVRPFVRNEQLIASINGAHQSGACILGLPAYETLKQANGSNHIIKTLNRDDVWLAQTPQVFRYDLILKAHEDARRQGYSATDDASLVERLGEPVKIIAGSRANIKITVKEDLGLARCFLNSGNW